MPSDILITNHKPTCFDLLPRELRDRIWLCSLPNPRILKADVVEGLWKQTFDYDGGINNPRYWYRIPNLLHICCESRKIALKYYQPLLNDPAGHPMFFFDPEHDVLSVGKSRYSGPLARLPLGHFGTPTNIINGSIVQRLAISQRDMKYEVMIHRSSLDEFPNITELFFFQSEPRPSKKPQVYPPTGSNSFHLLIHLIDQYSDLTSSFKLNCACDNSEYINGGSKKSTSEHTARKEGWASWKWTIHQINRLGEGLAATKQHLESAWNITADYDILPGPLVFSKSEDGFNNYLGLKKLLHY